MLVSREAIVAETHTLFLGSLQECQNVARSFRLKLAFFSSFVVSIVFAVVLVDALESYVNGDYHAMFIKKGRAQVRRHCMQGGRAPRDTGIFAHDL